MKKLYMYFVFCLLLFSKSPAYSQFCTNPTPNAPLYDYISVDPPTFYWNPCCLNIPMGCYSYGVGIFNYELYSGCSVPLNFVASFNFGSDSVWQMDNASWEYWFPANHFRLWSTRTFGGVMAYLCVSKIKRLPAALPPTGLILPANGWSGTDVNQVLHWSSVSGATTYRVMFYDDRPLQNLVYDTTTTFDSLRIPSGKLYNYKSYWWRVKPFGPAGEGPASDVFRMTFTLAAPPSLVWPLNSTTIPSTTPTLDWSDVPSIISYQVQVATDSLFNNVVYNASGLPSSFSSVPGGILSLNGTFYWRVRDVNASGTSDWTSVWKFQIRNNVWYPQNSGTNLNFLCTYFINSLTGWAAGGGEDYFSNIFLKTTNGGDSWFNTATPFEMNSFSMFFLNESTGWTGGRVGYLRKTTDGGLSWFSQPSTSGANINSIIFLNESTGFFAAGADIYKTTNSGDNWEMKLGGATGEFYGLSFPSSQTGYACGGTTGQGVIYKTTDSGENWTAMSGTGSNILYGICFVNVLTGWTVGSNGTILYTNDGNTWSPQNSGTTSTLRSISSSNAQTGCAAGDNGKIYYTGNSGTNWIPQASQTTNHLYSIFFNSNNGWAVGMNGTILKNSNAGASIPSAPILVSPADGATAQILTPILDWNDVNGVTNYRIQLSSDINFNTLIINDSSLTSSQYIVSPGTLSNYTVYYWRAASKNATGWSNNSDIWTFRTFGLPQQVVLINPLNNSTEQATNITFRWNNALQTMLIQKFAGGSVSDKSIVFDVLSPDAISKYWFEMVTDTISLNGLLRDSTLSDTSKYISGLNTSTKYYWRVKAKNEVGWGAFGNWWNFTTTLGPPQPPVLSVPLNNSVVQSSNLIFRWFKSVEITSPVNIQNKLSSNSPSTVNKYWFELTTDTVTFTGILRDTVVQDTFKTVASVQNSMNYFWRVKAKNESGWGVFSSWNRFVSSYSETKWTEQYVSIECKSISFVDEHTGWSVDRQNVFKTTNGGTNWGKITGWSLVGLNAISFGDINNGVIAADTYADIAFTGDGGNSWGNWNFVYYLGSLSLKSATHINGSPWLCGYAYFRSNNPPFLEGFYGIVFNGTTYYQLPDVSLNRIRFTNSSLGWIAAANKIYKIESGTFNPIPITGNMTGVSFPTPSTGYAVGGGYAYKSTNGGNNWITLHPITPDGNYSDVKFVNDNTGWIAGDITPSSSGILATTNGGANWAIEWAGPLRSQPFEISFVDPIHGWVIFDGTVVRFGNPWVNIPVLLAPPNNSTAVTLTPLLDWADAEGAVKYRLQISIDSTFAAAILDDSAINVSHYNVAGGLLGLNTKYYWRAATSNDTIWTPFSNTWNFTTLTNPQKVQLHSPANDSANAPIELNFTWFKPSESLLAKKENSLSLRDNLLTISQYWFELTIDTVSMAGLITDTTLTDSTKSVSGLSFSTVYYWRVKGKNETGWGTFSDWWKFTTTNGAPALLSPPYNATEIPVTPLLNWSDVIGAVKYRVQVSALSNFSVLWLDDSSSTISEFQVSPGILAYNSLYYWRVKTKNAVGWGVYQSPFRFFTQITPPPSPPVLVSPVNGAAGVSLTPALDWSDVSGAAKYRVQVSTVSNFTSTVIDDSSMTLSEYTVSPGVLSISTIYYWRAAAKSTSSWSSFSGAWNFRTLGTPTQVILYSPPNNSTEQPTSLTFLWYRASETLEPFDKSSFTDKVLDGVVMTGKRSVTNSGKVGADAITAYWFELVTDTSSLTGLIRDTTLADTTKALSGLSNNTSYFWHVKAQNSLGWGPFSTWWKFTTMGSLPPAPTLLAPPNKAMEIVVNPLLDWSDVTGVLKYHLQVSAYSNFSVLWINDSSSTISEFQVSPGILAYNSSYYWRVRAKNSIGWSSYQSPFRFFTQVVPPPALPTLLSPSNGSIGVTVTPTLDWTDPSGATKYRVQISTVSNFSTVVADDSSSTISQFTVSPGILASSTTYYWRVSVKGSSSWSAFTSAWNFRTLNTPVVTLYNPVNNSTEQPTSLTFLWYKAVDVVMSPMMQKTKDNKTRSAFFIGSNPDAITGYWFELVTDTVSLSGLIQDTTLTDTLKSVTGLSINTEYYWHVKAKNELGWGSFSAWWKFTTVAGLPPAPTLLWPAHNAADIVVNPLIDWSDVSGATKYHLQVSALSNFSVLWINDSSSAISQFQVSPGILAYNSSYYWRVRAKNFLGWGSYQTPFRFFTQLTAPPSLPALLSPVNGAAGLSLTPALDWTDASGATKYRVQVSLVSNFSTKIIDDSSSTISQFTVSPGILVYYTVYYWRVSAKGSSSWSSFTGAWNFRTFGISSPPVLYSPANNSTEQPTSLTFLWYKAAQTLDNSPIKQKLPYKLSSNVILNGKEGTDAISNYWFELVSDTVSMAGLVSDTTLADTAKSVTGLSMATSYFWHVKAKNELGWGLFSAWWKFTTLTGLPPSPPTLISPVYNATEIPVTPLLDWSDVPGAVKYRVQVSAYSNFSVLWLDDSSSTTISQFQVSPGILAYNSSYYWRVKAKNYAGWGNYSTAFRFFTLISPPPSPPTLISPANGAINIPLTPTLDWSDATGATKYRVQLSAVSNFNTTLADDSTLTISQYSVSPGLLTNNTVYYWRAAVKTSIYWSSFTGAWSFTTASVLPPPTLLYPANGDTGIAVTPLMDWSDVTEATKYRLQVSAFSNFSVLWLDIYTTSASEYQVLPGVLAYNSRYFWRVKTFTVSDSSAYSKIFNFFTLLHASKESKTGIEIEKSKTIDLNWLNSDMAVNFTIEISTDTSFTDLVMKINNEKLIREVIVTTDMLDNYRTYFWRVKVTEKNDRYYYTETKVFVTGLVKIEPIKIEKKNTELPAKFELYQNYPNPFNANTILRFDIPSKVKSQMSNVKLIIYDILGREVATIVNEHLQPGTYEIEWDANNYPSGVYYYRLTAGDYVETKKMVLIK